jgi:hypothetical protein
MANNFKNNVLKAAGTTLQNAYTAASGVQATVIGMTIANITTSPISANVVLTCSGAAAPNVYLVKDATIAPGGALVPIGGDQKLVLEAGDYLQVSTSVTSAADVITSVLEIT